MAWNDWVASLTAPEQARSLRFSVMPDEYKRHRAEAIAKSIEAGVLPANVTSSAVTSGNRLVLITSQVGWGSISISDALTRGVID